MFRPFHHFDHAGCSINGQRMLGEARSRRNVDGHFTSKDQLFIRCTGKERQQKVFKRDHADPQLYQVRIGQQGATRSLVARDRAVFRAISCGIALVVPL